VGDKKTVPHRGKTSKWLNLLQAFYMAGNACKNSAKINFRAWIKYIWMFILMPQSFRKIGLR